MKFSGNLVEENTICFHCGDVCKNKDIEIDGKFFCCHGCRTVYEVLENAGMSQYYDIINNPGISLKNVNSYQNNKFNFLEDTSVRNSLIEFSSPDISIVSFFIPAMYCSSCIWLLENLYKLNPNILHSEVNFLQKRLKVSFNEKDISLRQLVELLYSIGYEPQLNLKDLEKQSDNNTFKKLYYKLGIAGFCFGNIMLFSFPEYLGFDESVPPWFFSMLNLILSIPVFFYSASDYFRNAYNGLRQKFINIDIPISLGLFVLFARSVYEIISGTGAGFLDSMTGLIFLLLIGKVFQTKTYDALNFERNYKSYFPMSVTKINNGKEISIPVTKLSKGDRILIRNNELIPADGILFSGNAHIDYSFVTGESIPVDKVMGEILYAGGKHLGSAIEIEVIRTVSQSRLTQLWNADSFVKNDEKDFITLVNLTAKYFTILILIIAAAAAFYWYPKGIVHAINAFTAVLIVACPCGIALTSPFALGNALRILGINKFFLKNSLILEKLTKINTIIFDKTGTITYSGIGELVFEGRPLSDEVLGMIKCLTRNSFHPLSRVIYNNIDQKCAFEIIKFSEIPGSGISGIINNNFIKLGAYPFVTDFRKNNERTTSIHLSVNGEYYGYFTFTNKMRKGIKELMAMLRHKNNMILLSGDNESQKFELSGYFDFMHFNQSPADKMNYIKELQAFGHNILMVGDGLNDAGAVKQSNVGVVISDNVTGFSPASDAILDSSSFERLDDFIHFSKTTKKIIIISFIISVLYNILGVGFAFMGMVSPFLAAVLMPLSSVTVIAFTTLSTSFAAKHLKLKT